MSTNTLTRHPLMPSFTYITNDGREVWVEPSINGTSAYIFWIDPDTDEICHEDTSIITYELWQYFTITMSVMKAQTNGFVN